MAEDTAPQSPPQSGAFTNAQIPAPPEVKIRTMASDIEALARGGGTLPAGETVAGSRAAPASGASFNMARPNFFERHAKAILVALITIGIVGILSILGFIGYYFVRPFFT